MTVKENLIAARALIDTPEKWAKCPRSDDGTMCALRAVEASAGLNYADGWGAPEGQALQQVLDHMFGPKNTVAVGLYNDDPGTTHADIMVLFDRAIAAADDSP